MRRLMFILSFTIVLFFGLFSLAAQQLGADKLYLNRRYKEAVDMTLAEIAQDAATRDTYSVLCWSLIELGRYEDALEYGLQSFRLNRYDPRLIEVVGEAYYYLGKNLEALSYFEEYAAMNISTGARIDKVYYFMGEIFIRLGEYNHADIAFSTAVYHSRNTAAWWARLGYARFMAESYSAAVTAYERALVLDPGNVEARNGLQNVKNRSGA